MSHINGETGNINFVNGEFVEEDPRILAANFEELDSFKNLDGLFNAALKEAYFENMDGDGEFVGDVHKVSMVCNVI